MFFKILLKKLNKNKKCKLRAKNSRFLFNSFRGSLSRDLLEGKVLGDFFNFLEAI